LNEPIGLLETHGLTPTLAAVDAMEKAADIRVIQCELNDFYGVSTKIAGSVAAVTAAIEAGCRVAEPMGGQPLSDIIPNPDARAMKAVVSPREYNPLIEQEVVFFPEYQPSPTEKQNPMSKDTTSAIGLIETQGFTAVFEAIDTACKAANVEVVGKEKLGGGYITVIIRGDLSAVASAVEAGKAKVDELGKLIAAHVVARPSPAVLALLPKTT
jgi:microcompartment protein CcmL/EutN